MVRHVALTHHTAYRYDGPVRLGPHLIRLRPAPHCRSAIPAYALEVTPAAHRLHWHQDPHGNHLARVLFQEPTETLTVTVDLIVDMTVVNPFDFLVEPAAATFPFTYEPWLRRDLQAFLEHGPAGPRLSAWLATVDRDPTDTVSLLVALNLRLHQDLAYTVRFEPGVQDPEETLALGRGSCRDSAWLLAQVCRHLGLAARFVSGYLIQLVPDEPPREGPPGVAADTADLHAWAEVYLPGAGWVGFDPTSGLLVGEGHIPLAATPDPVNHFLWDVYHDQHILNDGVVPRDLVLGNPNYRPEMTGFDVKFGTYAHIAGIDIVRDETGRFLVLEDNARTPSGVSYVVENRRMMLRSFPDWMTDVAVRPVDDYGFRLEQAMLEIAPEGVDAPQVVLLSPGIYNSAYFEHVFLAREMGVPLVEGRDLVVEDDRVFMKTLCGPEPVHAIYRRVDDQFLDPEVFRPDSLLGVPGLMRAWRKGNVAIANAVGTGVADDKAVYAYMPRMIRYYLDEDPILDNVETHICREPEALKYTLDHLGELVVKPVGESGGYGILMGPKASRAERAAFRERLKKRPDNYISQPVVRLSVLPTLTRTGIGPRHVDLRPYAVTGRSTWVLPGGLTRVALPKGSLIVNSSQGGGSKDTWVLA